MNILPKKSWHVRNKDNVERVRKDEENARIEEEKRLKRIALAEQEARTDLLRKRAHQGQLQNDVAIPSHSNNLALVKQAQPVILFQKEEGAKQTGTNKEHEKDKKKEQEEYEKKLGILTYLGQGSVELQNEEEKPWYFRVPDRSKETSQKNDIEKDKEIDLKRKSSLDPLEKIPKNKKHRHKKHKHDKHKSRKSTDKSKTVTSMDILRAKRLKREAKEKAKTQALLNGSAGTEPKECVDETKRRYNSQYNPEFVKRTKYCPDGKYF